MRLKITCSAFCILMLLSAFSTLAFGQTHTYDIYKGSDRIGEILVTKRTKGSKTTYEANSNSEFRIIFSNEMETRLSADYENNELVSCNSKNTLNGKIRSHARMKKEGDVYHFFKHPAEKYQKREKPIRNSTVQLYFTEPLNITDVYSENYLENCPLKALGNHTYELVLPGGKINHYIYKNGKLEEIKVFRSFVDLSFRLRKQS